MVIHKVHNLPNDDDCKDQRHDDAANDRAAPDVQLAVVDVLVGDLLVLDVGDAGALEVGVALAPGEVGDGGDEFGGAVEGHPLLVGGLGAENDGHFEGELVVRIGLGVNVAELLLLLRRRKKKGTATTTVGVEIPFGFDE